MRRHTEVQDVPLEHKTGIERSAMDEVPRELATKNINPDKLARNIFLLCPAYVLAVAGSIWLFIRPV